MTSVNEESDATHATGDPKLTFVMPYNPGVQGCVPFYWSGGLAWPHNAERIGLKSKFIGAKSEFAESVLRDLENDDGSAIVFLCGDVHLTFLMDTAEKKQRLLNLQKPLICVNAESTLTGPFRELHWPRILHALDIFDCFLTSDETDMSLFRLRGAKVLFMPQQSDSLLFRVKTSWRERLPKGFFLGKTTTFGISNSVYRQRRGLIGALQFRHDFDFIPALDAIYSPDPLIDLYNKYQVCVCLPTNNRGITVRYFEAAMCGSTILHYELEDQPESDKVLKPDVNCLIYRPDDPNDLKAKLRFLIENPETAMQLATNALTDVMSNHTIAIRLQQLEAIARELLSAEEPVRAAYFRF